ncbi:hypothetical protein TWF694_006619 [Orbilia ellipsospora]|uniref:CFEM domain-containing protein n=1 Tax=Orbilia ellipsospora TaxID=2528407 RepID=A0AAV9XKQ7_9PEZI
MKTTSVLTVAAALGVSAVSAQTLMVPPNCAIECLTRLAPTSGCSTTNYGCFCQSKMFTNEFATCVTTSCSSQEFQTAKTAVEALCNTAGVSVELTPTMTNTTSTGTMTNGNGMNSTTGSGNFSASASPKPVKNSSWRQAEISLTALGTALVLGAVMFCA